jgi:hypothetical protein
MIFESYITYHRLGINRIRERFQKEIEEILRMEDTENSALSRVSLRMGDASYLKKI